MSCSKVKIMARFNLQPLYTHRIDVAEDYPTNINKIPPPSQFTYTFDCELIGTGCSKSDQMKSSQIDKQSLYSPSNLNEI